MPTPPILEVPTIDWTYEDVTEELEALAMLEDLEEHAGPSPQDEPEQLVDDDIARVADDLETIAALEGR